MTYESTTPSGLENFGVIYFLGNKYLAWKMFQFPPLAEGTAEIP
jgi:hypothetical protein